ncbi:MAG: UDP-N-acetylmuramoyl-tripeptide--D-alanyl-D-alanine ligase [Ichthyobacteriaceae bacterium]|nr:UDP-N-acetylmuramoyl-tripeptide--D-alanyl-D-alanine ligase [Ichthyobacteriaceae bacterium]
MTIENLYEEYCKTYKVSTDTRTIEKGSIYFALKGDNFNGNNFVEKALEMGASIAVIDEKSAYIKGKTFYADDVLHFLQKFANYHRKKLTTDIISITGTNGKTTSKELIYQVLSEKFKTVATKGNLNNHIGVPLTLLSITPDCDIAIVEMGANHPGEIADLCKIAMPDFGYITNFGMAHLEGFGSFNGVVKTKTELYNYLLSTGGLVFVNTEDEIQVEKTVNNKKSSLLNNVYFETANPYVNINYNGTLIKSKLTGKYNFHNMKVAITIGNYFGVTTAQIKDAIEGYEPTNNRSQIIEKNDNVIIMDAYNANPSSMKVAIENLEQIEADAKVAVLGDMLELGKYSVNEHKKVVDKLIESEIDKVFFIGSEFPEINNKKLSYFKNVSDLILSGEFNEITHSTVLIKGSRGVRLEKLME